MSKILHNRIRWVGLAACVMIIASIASARATTPGPRASRFNGETVFQGVFFRRGPAAPVVGAALGSWMPVLPEASYSAARAVVTRDDPAFFARFGVEMQSHDPARVERAVTGVLNKLASAADKARKSAAISSALGVGDFVTAVQDVTGTVVVCDDSVNCGGGTVLVWIIQSEKRAAASRLNRERRALALSTAL